MALREIPSQNQLQPEQAQPVQPTAAKPLEKVAGILLGCGIVAVFLGLWRGFFDLAAWFAITVAIFGTIFWLSSFLKPVPPLVKLIFKTVAIICFGLAITASLSLGALLPAGLAEWLSPPLAKFGGGLALTITGVVLVLPEVLKIRLNFAFDIGLACLLASNWVSSEAERQVNTPNPPLALSNIPARLDGLLLFSLIFGLLSLASIFLWYREARGGRPNILRNLSDTSRITWRWAALLATFGLTYALATNTDGWYKFALMLGGLLVLFVVVNLPLKMPKFLFSFLKSTGWVGIGLAVMLVGYVLTTEDLEMNFLKNTLEYNTQNFWRATTGDERFSPKPTSTISGMVTANTGQPLENATVIVAPVNGQPYTAKTGKDGRYTIANVPVGNYLPTATLAGYDFGASSSATGRVTTVREGQILKEVNFSLKPKSPFQLNSSDNFVIDPPDIVKRDFPTPS
jgi:hypothetical protein